MTKQLIEVSLGAQAPQLPSLPEAFSAANLEKLYKQVEEQVLPIVADVTTPEGRKEIKDSAAMVSKSNKAIDTPIRDHLRAVKAYPRELEEIARDSKKRFDDLKANILQPLLEAQADQDAIIAWLNTIPAACSDQVTTSAMLKGWIETINGYSIELVWPELKKKFKTAHEAALTSATVTLERVEAAEKQAAELELLRKQQAEAEQKERERQLAEEAANRARAEAEAKAQREREDIERRAVEAKQREEAAKLAEERAKRDLELAEQRRIEQEKIAQDRAQAAEIESKRQAELAAKQAAENERLRIEEENRQHEEAAKARAADKEHRIKINRTALVALVAAGISEGDAKIVITAIAKGEVPNINIVY